MINICIVCFLSGACIYSSHHFTSHIFIHVHNTGCQHPVSTGVCCHALSARLEVGRSRPGNNARVVVSLYLVFPVQP